MNSKKNIKFKTKSTIPKVSVSVPLVVPSNSIGIAHIQITLNSTFITITDSYGNTKAWASSQQSGFKAGKQRSSSYAAQAVGENAAKAAVKLGIKSIHARLKGIGRRKDSALRGLGLGGLVIRTISDRTPIPHNGCRPPKKRRI
uniref:Ribosomal protein S11 n=1 Tax=Coleochaete scutata TaxID=3125 RepID=A0A5P9NW12_COLSC|nr:ribosomal protein S11 [Coleochaete scutata]QFU80142.1 ribosomal protein S11 [Coleochaete scutata]QIQ23008.1 ribosomal protein S11 [Coleochaete scutata]